MTDEERLQIARAWAGFRQSPHWSLVITFLRYQAQCGQSPFAVAEYNPYNAARIDGQQSLVALVENQVEQAFKLMGGDAPEESPIPNEKEDG